MTSTFFDALRPRANPHVLHHKQHSLCLATPRGRLSVFGYDNVVAKLRVVMDFAQEQIKHWT